MGTRECEFVVDLGAGVKANGDWWLRFFLQEKIDA